MNAPSSPRSRLLIREATVADAAQVAAVHVGAWRCAYSHLLPAEVLVDVDVAAREGVWAGELAREDGGRRVWVADDGGRVVGFLSGVSKEGEVPGAEVQSVYVDISHWREGVGTALVRAATTFAVGAGLVVVSHWVVAGNERGKRFLASVGLRPDGQLRAEDVRGVRVDLEQWSAPVETVAQHVNVPT